MLRINGERIQEESMAGRYSDDSIKSIILRKMFTSERIFNYSSIKALEFELDLRTAIVHASEKLNNSYFDFAVFKESKCNPEFWERTQEGGFLLKPNARPFQAIRDIYNNSRRYATECATAIVIVFYLALTEKLPEQLFNRLFADIYLMDWKYLDRDLGVRSFKNVDSLPGDCLYFENPDFDPDTPQWRGENVIQLINAKYYGHGIGIRTAEGIIRALNQQRAPGATQSASLLDTVIRPNYKYLYEQYAMTNET